MLTEYIFVLRNFSCIYSKSFAYDTIRKKKKNARNRLRNLWSQGRHFKTTLMFTLLMVHSENHFLFVISMARRKMYVVLLRAFGI